MNEEEDCFVSDGERDYEDAADRRSTGTSCRFQVTTPEEASMKDKS